MSQPLAHLSCMYKGISLSQLNTLESHITFIGFVPMTLATSNNAPLELSIDTHRFFI